MINRSWYDSQPNFDKLPGFFSCTPGPPPFDTGKTIPAASCGCLDFLAVRPRPPSSPSAESQARKDGLRLDFFQSWCRPGFARSSMMPKKAPASGTADRILKGLSVLAFRRFGTQTSSFFGVLPYLSGPFTSHSDARGVAVGEFNACRLQRRLDGCQVGAISIWRPGSIFDSLHC